MMMMMMLLPPPLLLRGVAGPCQQRPDRLQLQRHCSVGSPLPHCYGLRKAA
jgi:hypothetical protein